MDKKDFICTTPFQYAEVHDKEMHLCCPAWLKNGNIYESDDLHANFHSEKATKIRESILDGSYSYCDENDCPALASLKRGIQRPQLILKKEHNTPKAHLKSINLCFDRSCNLECPSCRTEFINYLGNMRQDVDQKVKQIEDKLADGLQYISLSGSADPFYSKSFRQFLINFKPEKYPLLRVINIHTNGLLWSEKLWARMPKVHKFVKTANISIDAATKHTYENETRIGGKWETLIERVKFILTLDTIQEQIFSFVVQDTNYKEMVRFWEIFYNELGKHKQNKIIIFFNHIGNWGTYSEEEYKQKDVSNPDHPEHLDFIEEIKKIDKLPGTMHNFSYIIGGKKQTLI
jgi:hypothetical protein